MPESPASEVLKKIGELRDLYYRLILVVGPAGTGKTRVLREVAANNSATPINVSLELSHRMLDLTQRQRALQMPKLLGEIVDDAPGEPALLDNTEILFDPALEQDPLRLLEWLSRRKTIVATWNGSVAQEYLFYAVPHHPEYRRYPTNDLIIVSTLDIGSTSPGERHQTA